MNANDSPVEVLILDDDPLVLRLLEGYLNAPRVHLVTCSEIEAAECLLKQYHFDVLLTDLEVSDLGGLEGMRLIRHARAHFPKLQVIVFSGKLTKKVQELGVALGVTALVDKPVGLGRLKKLIGIDSKTNDTGKGSPGRVTRVGTLEEVFSSGSISAELQPIVRLDSSTRLPELFGVEGLARGPERLGLKSPELLLDYASKKERLFETELRCIEAVLLESLCLPGVGKLFINTRPRSLSNPGFATALGDLVRQHGYRHSDIVLELTEQQSILNIPLFETTLQALHEQGFGLALDDYGNGFANLHLVQHLPLDYLKIDGFFAQNIQDDPRRQAIVSSTLEMARELGISTIMERVETEEELAVARKLGATYAQGYYFSAPASGRELASSFWPQKASNKAGKKSRYQRPAEDPVADPVEDAAGHRVSNLLTAIALCSEQSLKKLAADDPLRKELAQILSASEEAISLTIAE